MCITAEKEILRMGKWILVQNCQALSILHSHLSLYFWTPSTALRSQPPETDCCIDCVELGFLWLDTIWFSKGILLVLTYLLWITVLFFNLQFFFWKKYLTHNLEGFFSCTFYEPSLLFVFYIKICYFFNCSLVKQGVFEWIALESGKIFFCYIKLCFHVP